MDLDVAYVPQFSKYLFAASERGLLNQKFV